MEILESEQLEQKTLYGPARWVQAMQAPKWTEPVLCFAIGLLLSAAPFAGAPAPFGIAMVSVMRYGRDCIWCFAGNIVGYCLAFGAAAGSQMSCGCLMVIMVSFILRNSWVQKQAAFPVVISILAFGITRISLYYLTGGLSVLLLARAGVFMSICGLSAYLFADVMSASDPKTPSAEIRRSVSTVMLLACLLLGLSRFTVWNSVSVGRALAVWILLVLSYTGGPLFGAAGGIIIGITMDIGTQPNAFFLPIYSLSAMLSGLFNKNRKVTYLISFILAYAAVVFCLPVLTLRIASLVEMTCASLVFVTCPQKWVLSIGVFVQPQRSGKGEASLRRYTAARIGSLSHAYRALYDVAASASEAAENDCDLSKVFDRAAEKVCGVCPRQNDCWVLHAGTTFNIMNDATIKIQKKGLLQTNDFPEYFQRQCKHLNEYTEIVNGELRLRSYRLQMHHQMREERAVLWEQYKDFSDILAVSAKTLRNAYGGDPTAERRLIRYLRTLGMEADASVFRDERGRLHASIESRYLGPLIQAPDYLDALSSVLGIRLCMPEKQIKDDCITLLEAEPYSASVGIAAIRKMGESVTGDRGTYFKTDHGELYVILSDGMGSGSAAAESSIGTIRILENFLRAGVEPSNAMKLLNAALLVKDKERWGYATVDLMCIDLFSGDARFYKYGAAPSYVRSGGVIKKIRNRSFAAGLSYEAGKTPDVMRVRLKPGSVAVIASDGIVSDGKDLWLRKLLEKTTEENMKKLAGEVVRTAIEEYGRNDDMTALAIKLEVRA